MTAVDTIPESQRRVRAVLELVALGGESGTTWKEVAAYTGWHHGQATGPLSSLHKQGKVARLTEKRNRCSVYVLPENVNGRETAPHGRVRSDRLMPVKDMEREIVALRRKLAKVEQLVAPGYRSYSYTRENLMDDIRRAIV